MNTTPTTHSSLAAFLFASAFIFVSIGTTACLQADTIGYWRFEGDSSAMLNDSSGNNLTLSPFTRSGQPNPNPLPAQYTLPTSETNAGYHFPKTISGQSNTSAIQGQSSNNLTFNHRQLGADVSAHSSALASDFSFEAFVNLSYTNGTTSTILAGQGVGLASEAGWALTVTGENATYGTRNILFQFSSTGKWDGTGVTNLRSNLYLNLNTDYYIAMTADFSGGASSITIYLKDLSNPEATLQTATLSSSKSVTATTSQLCIGAQESGGTPWYGTIDEVRLSSGILTESQLLINNIPEPQTAALIISFAIVFAALVRRRR